MGRFCGNDFQGHQILFPQLVRHIYEDRFSTYLKAAGFDADRAVALYAWNMQLAASFYPLLSAVEICLRNRIQPRLATVFGETWWLAPELHVVMGGTGKGIMLRAAKAIEKRGGRSTAGQMTAELSFGFWSNMLLPKYEDHLWQPLHSGFPDLPRHLSLGDLHHRSERVRDLRNRISHHEHIFRRNLTEEYSNAITLLAWVGPEKAAWIKPRLDTMKLLRARP